MAQTFTKEERLCSLKEINALLKDGRVIFHYPFRVSYIVQENQDTEIGINKLLVSVPKKNFKRAVHRNLLKRRVRESYRKNNEITIQNGNRSVNMMFVYISKDILEYSYIESRVKDILGKISQATEGNC